jgi:hypothetical protein
MIQCADLSSEKPWTVQELAKHLDTQEAFILKEVKAGRLRAFRLARNCIRLMPNDIVTWFNATAT